VRRERGGVSAGFLRGAAFLAVLALVVSAPLGFDSSRILRHSEAHAAEPSSGRAAWVVDGDTAVLVGGEKVRYLGIDTPERGEPFYNEAKERNKALVGSRSVRLEVCRETPRDNYGRLLAYVYADGVDVGATLLREGLARPLVIPPCGLPKAAEFAQAADIAVAKGIGVWSVAGKAGSGGVKAVEISPGQALKYVGTVATVTGKVFNVHRTKQAVFINFGPDWRRAFTAVIFKDSLGGFKAAGIDVKRYKGRSISVTGKIRLYGERAEIIISRPSQVKGG